MKIWLLDHHPANDELKIKDLGEHKRLTFDGRPMVTHWVAPKVTLQLKGRPTDFFDCHNGALLVSQRAKSLLEAHTYPAEAEFLPIEHEGITYYYMHILNFVSCIDTANSLEDRIGSGRLIGYKEYAFHEELVEPHHIMRVKYHEGDRVVKYPFISDHLHDVIVNSELRGYQLIEMWDSACSWQEKEKKFNELVAQSNRERILTFDYQAAMKYVEEHRQAV